jgi:hypothetical protein
MGLISWSNSLLSSLTTSVHSFILSLKGITSLQVYNVMYLRGYQQKSSDFMQFSGTLPLKTPYGQTYT